MTLIAGLDFGTSSVKLLVVAPDGVVVARAQAAYDTTVGSSGEVEQHPDHWWDAASSAFAATGVASQISAIGLTGQMQDLIAVGNGRALRPAMLYSDTRAAQQNERMHGTVPDWERRTQNYQDSSSVVAKIAWLAEHEPVTLATAEHLLFGVPGYIAWRAGGEPACDLTTASSTGLLEIGTRGWLGDAITAAGGRRDQLPRLVGAVPGDESVGAVSSSAAAALGVPAGTPLVLAMGDAGATTDGLVGSAPGDAYLYLGTTGWIAGVTPSGPGVPSPIHSLVMPGWHDRLRIGAVQSAGSAAAWALETFLPGHGFAEAEQLIADRVDAVGLRPLCLPGIAGERAPVRDGAFRGAFVGAQEGTGPLDFYLAVLTGVAMGLRHASEEMGIRQSRIPLVGGAASSPAWRRILADVFEATIVTGDAQDPAAHSAARAAAVALGIAHRSAPLLAPGAVVTETAPSATCTHYQSLLATHRSLYEALAPGFHALADFGRVG